MINNTFYHKSIRKTIIAFASLFNDISIYDENNEIIKIPLTYIKKEKFILKINQIENTNIEIKQSLPAMGFEFGTPTYNANEQTNNMEKLININNKKFMFNRVPYQMPFNLYIATRKIDDSLKIIEQILPYFAPTLEVEIKDMEDFEINTKIPFSISSTDFTDDADGDFSTRRNILWTIGFTANIYLYKNIRDSSLIKRVYVDMQNTDLTRFYESYMCAVDPISAGQNDDYTIIENITQNSRKDSITNSYIGFTTEVIL